MIYLVVFLHVMGGVLFYSAADENALDLWPNSLPVWKKLAVASIWSGIVFLALVYEFWEWSAIKTSRKWN